MLGDRIVENILMGKYCDNNVVDFYLRCNINVLNFELKEGRRFILVRLVLLVN